MCKSFAKQFFTDVKISYTVKDYVITHLLSCVDCVNEYRKVAKELGIKFNLRDTALDFALQNKHKKHCKTYDTLIDFGFEKDIESRANKFTSWAEIFDLPKLLTIKSFKDFSEEKMEFKVDSMDEDAKAAVEWACWYAEKLCKNLDMLERCLCLNIENEKEKNDE
jgi:hypothetical protein